MQTAKRCIKCGHVAQVQDHGVPHVACPACGAIYARVEAAIAAGAKAPRRDGSEITTKPLGNGKRPADSFATYAVAVAVGIALLITLGVTRQPAPPVRVDPRSAERAEARDLCVAAIRRSAHDPEYAEVPYVSEDAASDDGIYSYTWNQGSRMLRLRSRAGLDVAATGSCVVRGAPLRITWLSVDGQQIIRQ